MTRVGPEGGRTDKSATHCPPRWLSVSQLPSVALQLAFGPQPSLLKSMRAVPLIPNVPGYRPVQAHSVQSKLILGLFTQKDASLNSMEFTPKKVGLGLQP